MISPSTIVVDLDGTLANVDHRRHLVMGKHRDYEAFHKLIPFDPVNMWCKQLMKSMYQLGLPCIIVSARPQKYESATRSWLEKHSVPFTGLALLRPDDDSTPDQELKRTWLRNYGKEDVLFVIDDRAKVVAMWREEGMTALHCAEGKY